MSAHPDPASHRGAAPAAEPHGVHPQTGPRTYLVVATFLLLLTIMEVAVFYIPGLATILVPLLVFLSAAKFSLVAMFYMHLRFDHAWFTYLFVVGIVLAGGLGMALLWLFGVFGSTGLPPGVGG